VKTGSRPGDLLHRIARHYPYQGSPGNYETYRSDEPASRGEV